jgi:hypothetical protein
VPTEVTLRKNVVGIADGFDLSAHARVHRCQTRNIHDGSPVPPARRRKSDTAKLGYVGASDRWDAIVGCDGYIADEGEPGQLGIYLQYRSARGSSEPMPESKAWADWSLRSMTPKSRAQSPSTESKMP